MPGDKEIFNLTLHQLHGLLKADKANDKRSLERALDRRLYLIIFGTSYGSNEVHVWHFPEKVYESEETLHKSWGCDKNGLFVKEKKPKRGGI
ncbi:hypothetical protein ACS0TY_019314 [Phlomoides rotata]